MLRAALSIALCAGLLVSGCAGKAPPAPTGGAVGTVEGTVLDDADASVAGATAHVLLTNFSKVTDATGHFRIPDVPAGPVRVVVTADGYGSVTRDGTLAGGATLRLEFVLPSVRTVIPFHKTQPFEGTLQCGAGTVSCSTVVPGGTNHSFAVDSGLEGMVLELVWQPPAAGVTQQLAFDVLAASANACGTKYAEAAGPSVLRLIVEEGFPTSGGHQCVIVRATGNEVAVQQAYQLYVTLFYHEPPPEGFTAVSGSEGG